MYLCQKNDARAVLLNAWPALCEDDREMSINPYDPPSTSSDNTRTCSAFNVKVLARLVMSALAIFLGTISMLATLYYLWVLGNADFELSRKVQEHEPPPPNSVPGHWEELLTGLRSAEVWGIILLFLSSASLVGGILLLVQPRSVALICRGWRLRKLPVALDGKLHKAASKPSDS